MHYWKPGDTAQISDQLSPRYGEVGVVVETGVRGGLYIKHVDGDVIYYPWGYDIVR